MTNFNPVRAALQVMLHEARRFNEATMREAGIGPFDLVAMRQAEAALEAPTPPVDAVPGEPERQERSEPCPKPGCNAHWGITCSEGHMRLGKCPHWNATPTAPQAMGEPVTPPADIHTCPTCKFAAGAIASERDVWREEALRLREQAKPAVSTSGWLQVVQPPAPTKLQWDEGADPGAIPPTDISAPEARVDPMLLYYREWYGLQSLKGDPARRGNLARDAYLSGAAQGALLARTTVATIRAPAPADSKADWDPRTIARFGPAVNPYTPAPAAPPMQLPVEPEITVAECIAQLDVWNGHLEAAIDRQAHAQLGQHANDETEGQTNG